MSYQNYSRAYNISDHTSVYVGGTSNSTDYIDETGQSRKGFTWTKPKNSKLTVILFIGGGSGGGGGCASPTGYAAGGGGGGAPGTAGMTIIPSFLIPDTMKVLPGVGGGGGSGGTTNGIATSAGTMGSAGTETVVSFNMTSNSKYTNKIINSTAGYGGAGGTSSTGGGGGNNGTPDFSYFVFGLNYNATNANSIMYPYMGQTGSITASSTADVPVGYNAILLGGAGGGGVTTSGVAFPGGAIYYYGGISMTAYSFDQKTPNATSGQDGYSYFSDFNYFLNNFCTLPDLSEILKKGLKPIPGSGGGGNVNGNGGNGGNGAFGQGGGGGGGAQGTNVSGGRGGTGGPGLVIITSIF